MSARFVLLMLALSIFGIADAAYASTKEHSARQTNRTHKDTVSRVTRKKSNLRHIANRLVPPPPVYMPSILPELYYHGHSANAQTEDDKTDEVAEKPQNPYSRYFYSSEGDVPKATQARSGVNTWSAVR